MAKQETKACRRAEDGRDEAVPQWWMHPQPIVRLADFFGMCGGASEDGTEYWFRGHADLKWTLTPSALRYRTADQRKRALGLLCVFKRYAETKLPHLPESSEALKWVQLARHYGLPTRLLDWTKSAAVALYFACERPSDKPDVDGAVYMLNPKDLNRMAYPKAPRIYDAHSDARRIARYLALPATKDKAGLKTIAINPVWDSPRIVLQQGTFTLHGSCEFTLTPKQAPSIACWRVPREHKERILRDLEQAGFSEMSIFPEAEHLCRYLVWREKLDTFGAHNG